MPIDTMAFVMDTRRLSLEQRAVYLLLMMALWDADGRLPNEPVMIARILAISLRKWKFVSPAVLPFFDVTSEHITHESVTKHLRLWRGAARATAPENRS